MNPYFYTLLALTLLILLSLVLSGEVGRRKGMAGLPPGDVPPGGYGNPLYRLHRCHQNGLEVLIEPAKVKSNEITCSFFCDTYAKYKEFCTYLREHPIIELFAEYTGESYFLEFLQCSSFNDYRDYNIFGVKFRQANPLNLSIGFLASEVGVLLVTDLGDHLIV